MLFCYRHSVVLPVPQQKRKNKTRSLLKLIKTKGVQIELENPEAVDCVVRVCVRNCQEIEVIRFPPLIPSSPVVHCPLSLYTLWDNGFVVCVLVAALVIYF